MINYKEITLNSISKGIEYICLEDLGFKLSDEDFCRYNSLIMLHNMENVDSKLNKIQKENVINLYNNLILI